MFDTFTSDRCDIPNSLDHCDISQESSNQIFCEDHKNIIVQQIKIKCQYDILNIASKLVMRNRVTS